MPGQPYFSPQFDFDKFVSSSVVEALEKATSDPQFMDYVSQILPMSGGYMMNFGAAYSPAFTGMIGQPIAGQPMPAQSMPPQLLPGQPMPGQIVVGPGPVSSLPAQTESQVQPENFEPPVEENDETEVVEEQPKEDVTAEDQTEQEPEPQEQPIQNQDNTEEQKQDTDIWNQDEDDDDEDDNDELEQDSDGHEAEPETTAEPQDGPSEQADEAPPSTTEDHKRDFNKDRMKRRGRGGRYGYRGGRYKQHYDGYQQEYQQHMEQQYGSNYKTPYNKPLYYHDNPKRDYYGRPHRGQRGNRRGKENRGAKQINEEVKVEEPKFDEDGFEIVSKKTYTMPNKKGKRTRAAKK